MPACELDALPLEVRLYILQFLPVKTLLCLEGVNKNWQAIVKENSTVFRKVARWLKIEVQRSTRHYFYFYVNHKEAEPDWKEEDSEEIKTNGDTVFWQRKDGMTMFDIKDCSKKLESLAIPQLLNFALRHAKVDSFMTNISPGDFLHLVTSCRALRQLHILEYGGDVRNRSQEKEFIDILEMLPNCTQMTLELRTFADPAKNDRLSPIFFMRRSIRRLENLHCYKVLSPVARRFTDWVLLNSSLKEVCLYGVTQVTSDGLRKLIIAWYEGVRKIHYVVLKVALRGKRYSAFVNELLADLPLSIVRATEISWVLLNPDNQRSNVALHLNPVILEGTLEVTMVFQNDGNEPEMRQSYMFNYQDSK